MILIWVCQVFIPLKNIKHITILVCKDFSMYIYLHLFLKYIPYYDKVEQKQSLSAPPSHSHKYNFMFPNILYAPEANICPVLCPPKIGVAPNYYFSDFMPPSKYSSNFIPHPIFFQFYAPPQIFI